MQNESKVTKIINALRTKSILTILVLAAATISALNATAQNEKKPFLTTLRLEARGDFEYDRIKTYDRPWNQTEANEATATPYGFNGKYFNLHMGGNMGDKLSYYFRQRINANAGNIRFFDNTDFLYLNYQANKNWGLRLGKDALAIGGYEYDAPPIDILFNGYYWDMYYCFQVAASVAWTSNDGNHTLRAQVANSPYHHYMSPWGDNSMLSYNLLWMGSMGHFKTLYSANLFDNGNGLMRHVSLGNMLQFDRWNVYVDLIYRNTDGMDKACYSTIGQVEYLPSDKWSVFVKGSYVNNEDHNGMDCLSLPDQKESYVGAGTFFRPFKDVRLHAFVAYYANEYNDYAMASLNGITVRGEKKLRCNVGVTWNINILDAMRKHTSLLD